MKPEDVISALTYIACSPSKEHGGFDERVIEIAKASLAGMNDAHAIIEKVSTTGVETIDTIQAAKRWLKDYYHEDN